MAVPGQASYMQWGPPGLKMADSGRARTRRADRALHGGPRPGLHTVSPRRVFIRWTLAKLPNGQLQPNPGRALNRWAPAGLSYSGPRPGPQVTGPSRNWPGPQSIGTGQAFIRRAPDRAYKVRRPGLDSSKADPGQTFIRRASPGLQHGGPRLGLLG